ncbi:ABC transporter permease [Marinicrinis lubricantis]|uniref:ABC transporter permease n=1 Tax=Marinicrinis lubricantis TaxID=2086470 RepID=A0ABW1IV26_9BACL
MNLFEWTKRNVIRNFRLYTIYLIAMILGVIIHFTFSSLMFNQDILDALSNRENFQAGVLIASIAVFLFIIFFILYANSFFMRKRKKEFGMYLLLGLSEKQVTLMVLYETLMLGAVSLVTGILLGGLLSKLFGMLLMKLMQYDQTISLSFPLGAIGTTVLLFLVLAVIITCQSGVMVRRVQLVELFHAKEKMEKPFKPSTWSAWFAVILLGMAVFLISRGRGTVFWDDYAVVSMIAVTIGIIGGTYLFFRQFVGWLLQFIGRRPAYYEGNTVLWTSSLRFQVRSNTLNLTFISLFGALIILFFSFVAINYKVQFDAVGKNVPNHIAFESLGSEINEQIDEMIKSSNHPIQYHETIEAAWTQPATDMSAAFDHPEYFTEDVLLVPQQTYNALISLRGDDQEKVELEGNEAVSLSQGTDLSKKYALSEQFDFKVNAGETTLRLTEMKDFALLGWSTDPEKSMQKKPAVLVVADPLYESVRSRAQITNFEIYQIEGAKHAEALSREVHAVLMRKSGAYYSSFADVYSKQIESSSLMLFAGGFLALIALFALASVIYFKQLREATEEQRQFTILRKLGIHQRQLKSVICKKLLFVFAPPLLLGILHSGLIIKYYILDTLQDFPEMVQLLWGTIAIYFVVYLLFYLSSANLYYKIAHQNSE